MTTVRSKTFAVEGGLTAVPHAVTTTTNNVVVVLYVETIIAKSGYNRPYKTSTGDFSGFQGREVDAAKLAYAMGIVKKNVGNVDVHGAAFYRYVVDDKPEKYVLATQDYNTERTNPLMGIGMEAASAFRPEFEAVQDSLMKDHENLLEKVSARDLAVAEKSQRKTYVDAALRHVIQEAAEQGKKVYKERYTRRSTLSSVLCQLENAADNPKSMHGKPGRRHRRGRRRKGKGRRKNGRRRRRNRHHNVRNEVRLAINTSVSYIQSMYHLIGCLGKEAVLTALKRGKDFDVQTCQPWRREFYLGLYYHFSEFNNRSQKKSCLEIWRLRSLKAKYTEAFERISERFRKYSLSPNALKRLAESVSVQSAASFKRVMVGAGFSCLKKIKEWDESLVQLATSLQTALHPFRKFAAEEEDNVGLFHFVTDEKTKSRGSVKDKDRASALPVVVDACAFIENNGRRAPISVPNGTPNFTKPKMVNVDTETMAYMCGKAVGRPGLRVLKEDPWRSFFEIQKIENMGGDDGYFAGSLQTDGCRVSLSFVRGQLYDPQMKEERDEIYQNARALMTGIREIGLDEVCYLKEEDKAEAREKKAALEKDLETLLATEGSFLQRDLGELEEGKRYTSFMKSCKDLTVLEDFETYSGDPGVHWTFTAVKLGKKNGDIRDASSVRRMSNREWQSISGTAARRKRMEKLRAKHLSAFDEDIENAPFGRSSILRNYAKYTKCILQHWNTLLPFSLNRRLRQHHLQREAGKQRAIEVGANRLCHSESGKPVLLIMGDAADKSAGFQKSRGLKGPAKSIFYYCKQRKLAACVLASEFRTSKLAPDGKPSFHPPETRDRILHHHKYQHCPVRSGDTRCPPIRLGYKCKCYCAAKNCFNERTKGNKCATCFDKDPWKIHGMCFGGDGDGKRRAFHRDVCSAILIGLLFFASAMKIDDIGLWQRGRDIEHDLAKAKSWRQIFGEENYKKFGIVFRKRKKQK